VIVVCHDSGGPKIDIVRSDKEGFCCSTVEEYAETIERILSMPEHARKELRKSARHSALERFSPLIFEQELVSKITELTAIKKDN